MTGGGRPGTVRRFPPPSRATDPATLRILVLGDIHANPWGLRAAWDDARAGGAVDAVLCTGDLVDYGPAPRACVEWVRTHAAACVRGNHDHAVAQHVPPRGGRGLRGLAAEARGTQEAGLAPADLRYLARLPVTKRLALDGRRFLLVHGSPRDPLDDYAPADPAGWADRLRAEDSAAAPDFVLAGHTHQPYAVRVTDGPAAGAVVVNPGSAGQPRDGDPRAAYALIDGGRVELRRVAYDPAPAVAAVRARGWGDDATETAIRLLVAGTCEVVRVDAAGPAAAIPAAACAAVG